MKPAEMLAFLWGATSGFAACAIQAYGCGDDGGYGSQILEKSFDPRRIQKSGKVSNRYRPKALNRTGESLSFIAQ